MNENQMRLVYEALRLIQRRSVDPNRTREQRMSYSSAHDILWYALCENEECLAQYDDVKLHCYECARIESDDASDIQLCNACENHEFFSAVEGECKMKQIVFISEECHGTIGAASNFYKAKQFLLESGWVGELWWFYPSGEDEGVPIKEYFGENWQEKFLELSEDDFDGSFYFSEKDFLE